METRVRLFKEEFRNRVAEKLKEHKDELLDDEVMIEKLNKKIEELEKRIKELEENQTITTIPYTQPYINPWSPWTAPDTGTPPWKPGEIWCSTNSDDTQIC